MKQEMYGSGISWTICKQSAPRSRQITTPTPHHSTTTSVSHHISSSGSLSSLTVKGCATVASYQITLVCAGYSVYFTTGWKMPPKLALPPWDLGPPCAVPWAHPSLQPKWHFSRFCSFSRFKCSSWLCPSVTQTTPACMRCSLVLQDAEEAVVHSDLH